MEQRKRRAHRVVCSYKIEGLLLLVGSFSKKTNSSALIILICCVILFFYFLVHSLSIWSLSIIV